METFESQTGNLICLDLAAEGRLLWKITPEEGWAFEGTPDDVVGSTELSGLPMPEDSVHEKPTVYAGYTSLGFWLSPDLLQPGEAELVATEVRRQLGA